jgi:hypothetical protein
VTGPNIPGWESQQLDALASANKLYGVPPDILGAIDQAESSGSGGAINSSGYGGFFGLGAGGSYPAGTASAALLQDTSPAGFDTQAQLAASLFSQLLQSEGGNPYLAEAAYQIGGNNPPSVLAAYAKTGEGPSVFAQAGIPASVGAATSATGATAQTTSSVSGAVGQAAVGAIPAAGSALSIAGALTGSWSKDALSIGLTIVFTLSGLGLIVVGLSRLFPGVSTAVSLPIKP